MNILISFIQETEDHLTIYNLSELSFIEKSISKLPQFVFKEKNKHTICRHPYSAANQHIYLCTGCFKSKILEKPGYRE